MTSSMNKMTTTSTVATPWQLKPGGRIGPFRIGMALVKAVSLIRAQAMEYGHVNISYNDVDPLHSDITLTLRKLCIRMRFDPMTQRLKSVDVHDSTRLLWSYDNVVFSSMCVPTVENISRVFGPTFPPVPLARTNHALIVYPGVCFVTNLPLDDANRVHRVLLLDGSATYDNLSLPPAAHLEFEHVEARVGESVRFIERDGYIDRHSSTQDVLSLLGTPTARARKTVHKTKIHDITNTAPHQKVLDVMDYWFNYFHLGIDVLFDGVSHRVKKIILHSNFPGQENFCQYRKCNYSVRPLTAVIQSEHETAQSPSSLLLTASPAETPIGVDMKWEETVSIMGDPGQHLVHTSKGPFESSRSYAYDGVIFEIMQNGHQASVTLVM